jgi:hypothetical protein
MTAFGEGPTMRFIKPRAKLTETEYKTLCKRADELVGCTEGSPEEKELRPAQKPKAETKVL